MPYLAAAAALLLATGAWRLVRARRHPGAQYVSLAWLDDFHRTRGK